MEKYTKFLWTSYEMFYLKVTFLHHSFNRWRPVNFPWTNNVTNYALIIEAFCMTKHNNTWYFGWMIFLPLILRFEDCDLIIDAYAILSDDFVRILFNEWSFLPCSYSPILIDVLRTILFNSVMGTRPPNHCQTAHVIILPFLWVLM